jgi:hypothetical protein
MAGFTTVALPRLSMASTLVHKAAQIPQPLHHSLWIIIFLGESFDSVSAMMLPLYV